MGLSYVKPQPASRWAIFTFAAICTLLIVVDVVLAPRPGTLTHLIIGHILAIAAVWGGALLLARYRSAAEGEARRRAAELEATIAAIADGQDRTTELEAANAALAETGSQLRASWEQTQAFSRRLVEATENERKAIARELHDQSGQSLTSLMIGLGLLQRHPDCTDEMRRRLEALKSQTETIMSDLHRLSKDLRPAALDRLGLAPAVRQYAEAFAGEHGLEVQFEALGVYEDGNTPPEVKTALYRIVQEALTNVARHAQAGHVDIMLQRTDEFAVAIIEDDGVGFDVEEVAGKERLGLLGMRERVEMLGGWVELESSAGSGTTVIASVPLSAHGDADGREVLDGTHPDRG